MTRSQPFFLVGLVALTAAAACGPPTVVDPPPDSGVPPITAQDGGTDAGEPDAGLDDAGVDAGPEPCPRVGDTEAELRARCGEPCWTNAKPPFEPATQLLYDCEGAGGTCVGLDGGVAVSVAWCTP